MFQVEEFQIPRTFLGPLVTFALAFAFQPPLSNSKGIAYQTPSAKFSYGSILSSQTFLSHSAPLPVCTPLRQHDVATLHCFLKKAIVFLLPQDLPCFCCLWHPGLPSPVCSRLETVFPQVFCPAMLVCSELLCSHCQT